MPDAKALRSLAENFEITGPDADGIVWLVLHGEGTSGRAMFNLGHPDLLAVQTALLFEQDRRAVVSCTKKRSEGVTLSALQLCEALYFVAPDFATDESQREAEATIAWAEEGQTTDDDGKAYPAGWRIWLTEYPEEGCMPLGSTEELVKAFNHAAAPQAAPARPSAEGVGAIEVTFDADLGTPSVKVLAGDFERGRVYRFGLGPMPFLARDVAELLGIGVPELSAALVALGLPQRSQGMTIDPLEALAVCRARAAQAPAPAPEIENLRRDYARALDTIEGHAAQIGMLEQQVRELRAFRAMVNRHAPEFPAHPDDCRDVWYWQGDGEDHLESMTHQLPVVIRAEQLRELLAAAQAPAVTHATLGLSEEALADLIAENMHGVYHCNRVWSAWQVGTMSEDDFEPYAESESPTELAATIYAALSKPPVQVSSK